MKQWWMCLAKTGIRACTSNCHRCCVQVLLEWGADVDALRGEFKKKLEAAGKVRNMKGHQVSRV